MKKRRVSSPGLSRDLSSLQDHEAPALRALQMQRHLKKTKEMADKRHETAKRTRLTEEQDAANLCNALRKNMFRPSRNSALSREGSLYPSAVRTLFPRNSELDPYAFVSILLNESVLSILAAGINSSFAKKKKREKARVRELRDTNSDEVFRFILEYFRQNTSWGKQGMPEGDLMAQ